MKTLAAIVCSLFLAACSGSKDSSRPVSTSTSGGDLRRYEADFRPSDLDPEPNNWSADTITAPRLADTTTNDTPNGEMVQGFRVQLFSTTSFDGAKAELAQVESLFPEEWFYLEYDPPSYKIRAGNFITRHEADRFARMLVDRGYRSAWSVPQKVLKNPPPPAGREHQ